MIYYYTTHLGNVILPPKVLQYLENCSCKVGLGHTTEELYVVVPQFQVPVDYEEPHGRLTHRCRELLSRQDERTHRRFSVMNVRRIYFNYYSVGSFLVNFP